MSSHGHTSNNDDSTASAAGSSPFATLNLKPSKVKILKLNPTSVPLGSTFSRMKPFSAEKRTNVTANDELMLKMTTMGLTECYSLCDEHFHYDRSFNPKRVLTKPSRPVHNNGHDNEKWDYILYVNDIIGNEEGRKYQILDILGQGTFGQVVKCINTKTRQLCAVKVIKNQPAYFNQSMMEVTVLEMLNQKYDREDRRHIVRMKDTFIFRQHLCVVVELLSLNLYELIKQNGYRGFSLGLCRVFLAQTLDSLTALKEARIIHCDLKPENILLKSLEAPVIKVIDFGSACHEHQTVYTYIQSRFYRSPEIILGLPYTSSIDMWSLGCIAAELFLGLPIFPGCSNYDQISRIVESLGLPPHHMLEMGKETLTYFDKFPNQPQNRSFALKSRERYSYETGRNEPVPKKYFATTAFPDIILSYPMRSGKDLSPSERDLEMANRRCFADFTSGLLNLNPLERWNPYQAMQHPFITGKPFNGPFQPTILPLLANVSIQSPVSTTRVPVNSTVIAANTTNSTTNSASTGTKQTRTRPRANTLSTLTFQDVPPQLQKLAEASKAQPAPPPEPTAHRRGTIIAPQEFSPENASLSTSIESSGMMFTNNNNNSNISSNGYNNNANSRMSASSINASTDGRRGSTSYSGNHAGRIGKSEAVPAPAHQRLSAYMNNRRVSNPPSMFAAIPAVPNHLHQQQQQQQQASNAYNQNTSFYYGQNLNAGHPSSLPTSTGFFYPHSYQSQLPSASASLTNLPAAASASSTGGSPTLANLGRRNSLRTASQLSLATSVDTVGANNTRRPSLPFISGGQIASSASSLALLGNNATMQPIMERTGRGAAVDEEEQEEQEEEVDEEDEDVYMDDGDDVMMNVDEDEDEDEDDEIYQEKKPTTRKKH